MPTRNERPAFQSSTFRMMSGRTPAYHPGPAPDRYLTGNLRHSGLPRCSGSTVLPGRKLPTECSHAIGLGALLRDILSFTALMWG